MRIVLALVVLVLVGCSHSARRGEDLFESLRTYHEGVRWERFPAAASRIPAAQRSDFVEERDKLAEDLRISDYEIVRVASRDERRAKVHVKYTWYLDSEGIVRYTHAMEGWERTGKVWLLVEERLLRGDAMPGLAGADKAADDATGPPSPLGRPASGVSAGDRTIDPSTDDAQAAPGP